MNVLICQMFLLIFAESLFVHRSKGYVLLSQNKNVRQSSTYNDDTPAKKAVDGSFIQTWPNVAATKIEGSVNWYVDLGSTRNINNVKIYYRNETGKENFYRKRFSGFSLYISDDTSLKSGHNCGVNSTHPPLIYNISCPYTGRYVRLYNSRNDNTSILELAEVQVFGCMSSTKYGVNCQYNCSTACEKGQCNVIDGKCFSCATGFILVDGSCECGHNKFGSACAFECGKCKDGESCNKTTGECHNGCAEGFYPPMCNMSILSETKDTYMSTAFNTDTTKDKAVDGILSQKFPNMSVTIFATNVYWYVDLGSHRNIHNIKIYYRDETEKDVDSFRKRFAGFSLYISDDRNNRTGHKCSVNSAYPPLVYNIFCQYRGRYVKLYNYKSDGKAILELGEVQVFGCSSSIMYGVNCENRCSSQCKNQRCNVVDGKCFSCVAGYKGDRCEIDCPNGTYGEGCTLTCSDKCAVGSTCNRYNGNCSNGCIKNYYGPMCNTACPGFCKNDICNQTSGKCDNGCRTNYHSVPYCIKPCSVNCKNGDPCSENDGACDKGCKDGFFGFNCTNVCNGSCINGENCDQATGNCENGCAPGKYEKQCNQNCPSSYCANGMCNQDTGYCDNCKSGYFGLPFCSNQCSGNCKYTTTCNQHNGQCDDGCTHGYYGSNCNSRCSGNCKNNTNCQQGTGYCIDGCAFGYYSLKCNSRCSGKCKNNATCNSTSGFCDNGCDPGYKGNKCDKECDDFKYGPNCKHECGTCRERKTCNKISGECNNGCDRGYQLPFCNTTCSEGFYGYDCNETCIGHCINRTICNATSGYCDGGCDIGYEGDKCSKECDEGKYGHNCEEVCSGNCKDRPVCHHATGVCQFSCKDGFYGGKCQSNCSGNCLGGELCNNTTGVCDSGCAAGWQSRKCNEMCSNMTYGQDCGKKCGFCKVGSFCNRFDGTCEQGCRPGYRTKLCNKECNSGQYGQNCSMECSGNCINNSCDKENGSCDQQGCKAGWKGRLCDKKCPFGFFGDGCSLECSGNCLNNETCHHTNGSCLLGCAQNWDGTDCDQKKEPLTEPDSSSTVGIVAGIAAIIVVVVVIVGIIYMRRRRKQPDAPFSDIDNGRLTTPFTEQRSTPPQNEGTFGNLYANSAEVNDVDRCSPNDETYYNMTDNLIKANEDVKIDALFSVIQNMSKNGNALFSKEYKELPQGEQHPCDFGKKQENMPKNRFKTTFPYDHSRVVLQLTAQCNSDYINADYIKNVNGDRVYIAAQGPKTNTLTDFWRMVWQERVFKIVMLTNLVEGIKKKCDQYWPDTGKVMRKGDYVIQLQEEKIYASYIIRTLMVTNKTTRQDRMVVHFHYTQWPDHGVPDSLSLVMFYRHVIRTTTIETGKYTVVHCSAGIGRTGTYIALDALYQYGEKTGSVNVPNYVRTMRKDRMSMIQNEDQYVTVYNALHEAFRGRSRVIPKDEFANEVEKQTNPSTPVNITYLRTSFNELNLLIPSYTEDDFFSGHENIGANFTTTVLPVERFRCNLYSYVKGRGSYYNAVYLQSFSMKDGLVSAQFPLPDYTEDFLRLIEDVEADIVVFVNPLSQIESTHLWMPVTGTPRNVGTITVTIDSPPLCTNNVKKTSLVLKKGESEGHKIDVFEPVSWSVKEPLPSDPRVVLDLANQVQGAQTSKINKRIIVLSADGAGGCGVFCSVFNGLQQLTLDSEVDMFSIIRQLKIRRPEMILNLDEYQFCFKVVAAHLKDDDIYANC